jgi:hypothetical protein
MACRNLTPHLYASAVDAQVNLESDRHPNR